MTRLRFILTALLAALWALAPPPTVLPPVTLAVHHAAHAPEVDEALLAATIAAAPAAEPEPAPVTQPAPTPAPAANPAAADPGCDGKPCPASMDGPHDAVTCPTLDAGYTGTYTSGARQLGGACPEPYAPDEPHVGAGCPPDEWRRGDVRLDAIAESEGCGPMLADWT